MRNEYGKVRRTPNLHYALAGIWRMMLPRFVRRWQRSLLLRGWERRADADEIRGRVDFYCRRPLGDCVGSLEAHDIRLGKFNSGYVYDLQSYLRSWPGRTRLNFLSGDTWENPDVPTVMKARRLDALTPNVTLISMDKRRHFMRVRDNVPFGDKIPKLFFRGAIKGKPLRLKMMEMWADADFADFGDTATDWTSKWSKPFVDIPTQFRYRFILCPEGNDVCSSLQWVMASGCVPVMPRPTVEGWLMHSAMKPGVHYIEVAPDYSDLGDKMAWYISHPEDARHISEASSEWARKFDDPVRERIISHLVLMKYLDCRQGI